MRAASRVVEQRRAAPSHLRQHHRLGVSGYRRRRHVWPVEEEGVERVVVVVRAAVPLRVEPAEAEAAVGAAEDDAGALEVAPPVEVYGAEAIDGCLVAALELAVCRRDMNENTVIGINVLGVGLARATW